MFIFETDITHNDYLVIRPEMVRMIRDCKFEIHNFKYLGSQFYELYWKLKGGGFVYVVCFKEHSAVLFACETEDDMVRFRRVFKKSIFMRCNVWKNFKARLVSKFKRNQQRQDVEKITAIKHKHA